MSWECKRTLSVLSLIHSISCTFWLFLSVFSRVIPNILATVNTQTSLSKVIIKASSSSRRLCAAMLAVPNADDPSMLIVRSNERPSRPMRSSPHSTLLAPSFILTPLPSSPNLQLLLVHRATDFHPSVTYLIIVNHPLASVLKDSASSSKFKRSIASILQRRIPNSESGFLVSSEDLSAPIAAISMQAGEHSRPE